MEVSVRSDGAGDKTGSPGRVRWLIAVVAVMAVLTAGWPLVSLAVSDNQPAAAGRPLTVGPDSTHSALFTPGRGWVVRSAETDPKQAWVLRRGPADVSVTYVTLISHPPVEQVWLGLQDILRVDSPSAHLGKPALVANPRGGKGLTGTVTENGRAGQAAIFPGPTGDFAIEIVAAAPAQDSPVARAAAVQVVRSLRFPAASR
jgi:hypothetical protein